MSVFLRPLIAIIAGLVVGSIVNMGIITFGGKLIPPPAGADVATMEGLTATMHLFESKHFLTPFLAHALGTFVGALVAALIASKRPLIPACIVGGLFLLGGIAAVFMLPAPAWFNATDLLLAYAPATWLALKLAQRRHPTRA
ncbi:MAG TPA: hypothetical protein PKO41_07705 [Dokdonella sp.]|uniref:hypothetical protein n=1 Tax=Dokdonella sp. TaxID=2291710 RepID=UPI0025BF4D7E|nr:hypothetical protein [Dokdonella sp.]MBX3691009.1 hypothetical protein [Dokdonella sp.]MCW5569237.1 hypothetical protein [Dokdonella sp.]HNR92294.1 hypothetical protein [Dokdonella sp.]